MNPSVAKAGGLLFLSYAGVVVLLWLLQERLIFPAPAVDRTDLDAFAHRAGIQVIDYTAADNTPLYAWHHHSEGERLIIYLPGNGEAVISGLALHTDLVERGWDVLVPAYRGYPGSGGRPSEAGMRDDARTTWQLATEELGFSPDRIVIHGRSLGGGVAGTVLPDLQPAGFVFESTFCSLREVASSTYPFFPVRWLLRHSFETGERAPDARAPALVMHSRSDEMIPVQQARDLADRLPDVTYVEIDGIGHNESAIHQDPSAARAYWQYLEARVPRGISAARSQPQD